LRALCVDRDPSSRRVELRERNAVLSLARVASLDAADEIGLRAGEAFGEGVRERLRPRWQ
jgi:hypothetical protein